jgi:GH35 family endo-1,4-beta-xylanase
MTASSRDLLGLLETEKGKWTFSDDKIDAYRKANLNILGFLGSAPAWASWNPGVKHKYIGFTYFYQPKDEAAFMNYVRTVVSRYRGVIGEWQFQNEPWGASFWHKGYDAATGKFEPGESPAEDYAAWSKIAYEEMKRADPSAKMYGFNSFSGPTGGEWTRKVYAAGAYPFCDMIDITTTKEGKRSTASRTRQRQGFAGRIGYLEDNAPNR